MGIFHKLKESEIPKLADNLFKLLPRSSSLYNVVRLYLEGAFTTIVPTSFFAYDGIIHGENAFIVSRQEKEYYNNAVTWVTCSPAEPEYVTEDMFTSFELLLDWTIINSFTSVHINLASKLETLCRQHDVTLFSVGQLVYYMDTDFAETAYNENGNDCPYIVKELDIGDAEKVDKLWEYGEDGSIEEIRESIKFVETAGLIVENELVSWACGWTDGAIHALFTMENHRGKGYGKIILKYLAKKLAMRGMYATTQVDDGNVISSKLMMNSGFKLSHKSNWMSFSPVKLSK